MISIYLHKKSNLQRNRMAIAKNIITLFFITISFVCKSADAIVKSTTLPANSLFAFSTDKSITIQRVKTGNIKGVDWIKTAKFENVQCSKMIFNPNVEKRELAILGTIKERVRSGGTSEHEGLFIFDLQSLKCRVRFNQRWVQDMAYSKNGSRFALMTNSPAGWSVSIWKVGEGSYVPQKTHKIKNEIGPESKISCLTNDECVVSVYDSKFPFSVSSESF